jgi:ATP-dependent DNA helicase PIF1
MELSDEQTRVFNAYKNGQNIFLTGPGGAGKSHLIRAIVLDAKENDIKTAVCATTGCAAILLGNGSKTLHSWAGIGLARGNEDSIVTRIMVDKYKSSNWKKTQLLILDEVSMLSKQLFELLDRIGKRVRKCCRPFGGLQIIFSGDFYQLPPVGNADNPDSSCFCFESELWNETFDVQQELTKIFRQKDKTWIKILHQIRKGAISRKTIQRLNERVAPWDGVISEMDVKPVSLMPTRREVQSINYAKMKAITTDKKTYVYKTDYTLPEIKPAKVPTQKQMDFERDYLLKNGLFEEELELKVGAQVMCIANLDMEAGICNGSTGIVESMHDKHVIVRFGNGVKKMIEYHAWMSETYPGFSIQQLPLIPAWAVTIHKSQGATLEKARMNLGGNVFACGQTYVALSRVKTLEGLYLDAFDYTKIKVSKKVQEFYDSIKEE